MACLLLGGPPALASAAFPTLGDDDRASLEDLARAAEAQRLAELEQLQAAVDLRMASLRSALERDDRARLTDQRDALIALGPAAAPLLVEFLDPGEPKPEPPPDNSDGLATPTGPSAVAAYRVAAQVTRVLMEIQSPAITDDLLALVEQPPLGRAKNALRVLGSSTEAARIVPRLQQILDGPRGQDAELRGEALRTLSRLGGPEATAYLRDALGDENPVLVEAALAALAETANAEAADAVLALLADQGSQAFLRGFLSYYRAVPELCVRDHQRGLVELATRRTMPRASGAAVLDMLRELDVAPDRSVKKTIEDLQDSPSRELSEAAMAWLASRGDRGARRRLIGPFDAFVDQDDENAKAYLDRGAALARIHDWGDALRDYREVLRLARQPVARKAASRGAARCAARLGKFKDAQEILRRSSLTKEEIAALATEPAFAEMIRKPKYRAIFGLPDEDA